MIKAVLPADHFNDSQEKINVGQSWDLKVEFIIKDTCKSLRAESMSSLSSSPLWGF